MLVIQFIKFNKCVRIVGFLSAVLLFILSSLTIIPLSVHTDRTEAATGTATSSTLSLDITNATASVDLAVASANGTFASSSVGDEASFSVTTNNYTGYTLSISTSDNDGELVNGEESLDSISSSLTASQFDVSANNGKWGYKPSKYRSGNTTVDNTGSSAVYLTSPTTSGTTLDVTTTPNNNANSYTIALGARADYSKPAGTYTKTFILTAVTNETNYTVSFNPNSDDSTIANMPTTQSGSVSTTSITLPSTVPTRTHYSFLGWCNLTPTTTSGVDSCTGTGAVIYNPNGAGTNLTYGIDQTTTNTATLYAMWKRIDFTITLDSTSTGATTSSTPTSTTATLGSSTLSPSITVNPSKVYTISGLTNNGSGGSGAEVTFNTDTGSVCTSISNCKYTYTFDGWYTAISGTSPSATVSDSRVITTSGNLVSSISGWTDSNSNWLAEEDKTVYAGFTSGTTITLPTITKLGYTCGWATSNNTTTRTYSSGQTGVTLSSDIALYGTCTPNTYTITLTNTNATTAGSTSVNATYDSSTLSSNITKPSRVYSITGFSLPSGNNASGASVTYPTATGTNCSSASTCSYAYSFKGWYTATSGGTKIIDNSANGALTASNGWTDSNSKWTATSDKTVFAQWDNGAVTLPAISKAGHTCGWTTTSTGATSITYESSKSDLVPTSDMTLYGVCTVNGYLQTTKVRYENADGTFTSYTTVDTATVNYGSSYSWSTAQISNFDSTTYQSASVSSYTVTEDHTNEVTIFRNTFTCTAQYKLMNADGTYPSTYTTDTAGTISNVRYGSSCSYTTTENSTIYINQTVSKSNVTSDQTLQASVPRNSFTCTRQYRLENADGTWGNYTSDGTTSAYYGGTCSYSKTVTDYKGSASGTNNTAGTASASDVTGAETLQVSLFRNTFALTVDKNATYISSASASTTPVHSINYYRWGQTVAISATASSGNEFTTWSQTVPASPTSDQTVTFADVTSASTTITMPKSNITVYADGKSSEILCDNTKLCVQYNGNGLTYDGKTVNRVNYSSTTSQSQITKILHSDNVGDNGIATGNSAVITDQTKETTIDGASSVNVTLYYDTEGVSFDWVTLYAGADSVPSSANDGTIGSNGNLTGKLGGNKSGYTTSYTTWNMWNNSGNAIDSDTIKIHFKTDGAAGSYISYGYYAIITGTGTTISRTVSSGEYTTPTGTNAIFHGWSSTQTTAGGGLPSQVEYTNESEVKSKMPGDNGEAKTLYAVWQQGQNITFNMDSNVSSIAILNSDGTTAGTITTSGQSLVLAQGSTYTIKPTYVTGYTTSAITKTSGIGTIANKFPNAEFTVGSGAATVSVTSRVMLQMQNYSCSNLVNIGDTDMVYDTRDNEAYLIGKLADGKCWLLDNLRLDLVAHKNDLDSANTNATIEQLAYLKGASTGTSSDKWAMSGVAYWTSSKSYSAPLIAIKNTSNENWSPDTVASVTYGDGSGKIGVYYNYCAASAGTYCWGNGTSWTGSPSSDPKTDTGYDIDGDICPAGWRMPTGGAIATGTVAQGEYQSLANAITGDTSSTLSGDNATAFKSALSTPLSGYFGNGSAGGQGNGGFFWSSTWYDRDLMYYLYVNSSDVNPQYTNSRNESYPVRCIIDTLYLQDQTASTLAAALPNVGDTKTYYDKRDDEPYLVGHLADGNYWLLDNLRLDLVAHKDDLSEDNTNATNAQLAYLKGTSTGTSSDQWAMSGVSYWTSSYSYSAPWIAIKNASNESWNPNTVASVTYGDGSGKIGVYYNYCAASAGTYCWGDGTEYTGSPSSDPKTDTGYDIDGDICPAGWRMPTGGAIATGTIAKGEYQSLANAITGGTSGYLSGDNATAFKTDLSTPLSGYFGGGSASDQGSGGYFWSSTWWGSYRMYSLYVTSSSVRTQYDGYRNTGYSIRCVLQ